jgi:SAM-dependent methyltransferase
MDLSEKTSNTIRHPWETSRARLFLKILRQHVPSEKPLRLLDVGCGDCFFLKLVQQEYPHISCDGLDIHLDATARQTLARQGIHATNSLDELKNRYDIILLLDVIEHIPEDTAFLKKLIETHAQKGCLFITSVPAYPSLFSSHDAHLNHHRRYSPHTWPDFLKNAGLIPEDHGALFLSLLFFRTCSCLMEKITVCFQGKKYSGVGEWRHGQFLTKTIESFLNLDNALLWHARRLGLHLPGLSLWTVAKTQND